MRRKLRYFYSIEFSRVFCLSFAVASKTSGLEATRAIVFGETVEAIEESTTHVLTIKVALAVEATETVGILASHTITVIVEPIVVAETVEVIKESTTHVLLVEVEIVVLSLERTVSSPFLEAGALAIRSLSQGYQTQQEDHDLK